MASRDEVIDGTIRRQDNVVFEWLTVLEDLDALAIRLANIAEPLTLGGLAGDAHTFVRAAHERVGQIHANESAVLEGLRGRFSGREV